MNTNTTTIQSIDEAAGSRGGEPDEPGSSGESDLPPEPAPVDTLADSNFSKQAVDVIASQSLPLPGDLRGSESRHAGIARRPAERL